MKNRTSLTLIEISVMLLVFVAAAALCLQAFAWADNTSQRSLETDRAYLLAQNAVAVLKSSGGNLSAVQTAMGGKTAHNCWQLSLNGQWQECADTPVFLLTITLLPEETAGMGQAKVAVHTADGEVLVHLPAGWQEVAQ